MTRQVALFLASNALLYVGLIGISDAILNFYFVSLGHGSETIGMLQSLPRVGGLLTSLPIGLLADRFGTRRIIIVSTLGVFGTYAMLVMWPDLVMLGISRFLLGLFYGGLQIASTPLLIALSLPEHEVINFSYLNVANMAATAGGSLLGGVLPSLAAAAFPGATAVAGMVAEKTPFAYQIALGAAGVIILISVIPLLRLHDVRNGDAPAGGIVLPLTKRAPWRTLIRLSSPMLVFGFTGGLTFPFYNLFFRTMFDVPDRTIGTILSLGWLGMAIVPLATPRWERRYGRAPAVGLTLGVAALAFLGLSVASVLAVSVACYIVAISFRNAMQPLLQPLIMDSLAPGLHNIASSVGMVLWNIGWFSATAISGFWQEAYGFDVIMRIVAVGVLVNGVMVVLLFRKRPPARHTTTTAGTP